MRFLFILISSFYIQGDYIDFLYPSDNLHTRPSYNSFGHTGLVQLPSAETMPEGTLALNLNRNSIWKVGTLTASPFDWLEASYFYYRPSDLTWEVDEVPGHFLDKGFNVKLNYKFDNKFNSVIAIGLDDFAGTGYFTREYLVSTSQFKRFKASLGIGWGKFAGSNSFKNPLSFLSDKLNNRPNLSENIGTGGKPSFDKWFRGQASLFGGVEYTLPRFNHSKFIIEYDPFDYFEFTANGRDDANYELRNKDSNINVGLSIPYNDLITFNASYIKGNTFNISLNIALTFDKNLTSKPKFKPNIINNDKNDKFFYEELVNNLNKNRLFLQTATLDQHNLDISISTSDHRNAIRSSSYAAYIANEVANLNNIDINTIKVSHINAGIELNNITYIASHLSNNLNIPIEVKKDYVSYSNGEPNGYLNDDFKPRLLFPLIFSSTSPKLITHIGNPEKFYFGGINIKNVSEIQFSRNLILSTEIELPLYSNIRETITGPASDMEHVRTDLVQYLKEDDLFITRMQLDYIWSPYKNTYAKISSGLYESMFGGIGAEILHRPFSNNFSIGAELFYVKQRDYGQKFDFREYKTTTGHLNIDYLFPSGIEARLSYGRYLAKDDGYTIDLSRRTKSGFKAGVYFTQTNVSASVFGEGSFDKGFYIQIPMDLLSKNYVGNYSNLKLSPLTRDGGARLIHDKDLRGLIYNSRYNDLVGQWDGYLN